MAQSSKPASKQLPLKKKLAAPRPLLFVLLVVTVLSGLSLVAANTLVSTSLQPNTSTAQSAPTPANPPVTTQPTPTVPSPTTSPAPQSPAAKPANITHPTAANCLPGQQTFTVYASLEPGTPAYSDNPAFSDGQGAGLFTVPYKKAITNVFCTDTKTKLYHYEGRQIYTSYQFADVSTTQP